MAGIYLHIPFCRQACHYCNFHFSTSLKYKDRMVECIANELELRKAYIQGQEINSIYFGGGSPSLLSHSEVERLLLKIGDLFIVSDDCEITLEANPDDMSTAYLKALYAIGVNRLSVGIQSFDDEDLLYMNRAHNATEAKEALINARNIGFLDFSIDLIYGSHTTSDAVWERNIDEALKYRPTHISTYCMTIEEGTAFGHWKHKGKMEGIDEAKANRQFALLQSRLEEEGFIHYEISNFALEDHFAIHNSNYWKGEHYLGVGPAAHSFDGVSRGWNPAHNVQYIDAIDKGEIPMVKEVLTTEDQFNEYIMTGLRTIWGIDLKHIKSKFGVRVTEHLAAVMDKDWISTKIIKTDDTIRLNTAGKNFADRIASECFI